MKIKILSFLAAYLLILISCDNKIEDNFVDPSKTTNTSIEYLMSGTIERSKDYFMPYYLRHFVFTNNSIGIYCQSKGWINGLNQYIPGSGATDRWNNYYNMMRQYREFELKMVQEENNDKRIFLLASRIFFYDQTQQMVDMWGDIPWSDAGRIKENSGNINASKPKFDSAEDIYIAILDDLKSIADELNSISVPSLTLTSFSKQDLINKGDLQLWKKYCNSLRLRMLIRVSAVSSFSSRAKTELSEIIENPSKYPVIDNNKENILVEAEGTLTHDNQGERGIRGALESWNTDNVASYRMVQFMLDNNDPRLEVMFAPNSEGNYIGLDPELNASKQDQLVADELVSRLDSATYSRNIYVPGIFISASELSFIKAEAIAEGLVGSGDAKAEYEKGIRQAIEHLFSINALSEYASPLELDPADIDTYLTSSEVNWDSNDNKKELIGTQKWLAYNYLQPEQSWTEIRRTGFPVLNFKEDTQSEVGKYPPMRLLYPSDEGALNYENYQAVAEKDKLTTKIFWDVD